MKLQTFAFAAFLTLLPPAADAQMFNRPTQTIPAPQAAEAAIDGAKPAPAQPAISAQDIIEQINAEQAEAEAAPITMTPEQKAAVKKPLVEQIINDVDKATPKERRELVKVIEQLQKVQTRRQNLNLPADKQIKLEEPRINAASKEDVQKYLQDKLVAPIDRVMNTQ